MAIEASEKLAREEEQRRLDEERAKNIQIEKFGDLSMKVPELCFTLVTR